MKKKRKASNRRAIPMQQGTAKIRSEEEIFAELGELCTRPGYIHALAYICFRDNMISHDGTLKETDLTPLYKPERLIRTEILTLLGLAAKSNIDWTLPSPESTQEFVKKSDSLLLELHHAMNGDWFKDITPDQLKDEAFNPFNQGKAMREPIFYSGESAYDFQYISLARQKYATDAEWLQANKGFTIDDACTVFEAINAILPSKLFSLQGILRAQSPDEWTMLPAFTFTESDLVKETGLAAEVVARVIDSFTLPAGDHNATFKSLQDFNAVNGTPLLRMPSGEIISLHSYALAEALYDTPFYWMTQDKEYANQLAKNRGDYAENFSRERLAAIFGNENVHLNVDIYETKSKRISDVDVLVIWGDRAIIVQTKSKKLTIEARKGNDRVIKDDFKKGIQAAYDQGILCAKAILSGTHRLISAETGELNLAIPKEVYIFCMISDNYPALSFQTRQFLKTEDVPSVQDPLILDLFTLDVMSEMLETPLAFLSYVNRRSNYTEQLLAAHDLTILGYHLKHNLWVKEGVGMMHLHDDFSAGLDVAMAARRAGIPGERTPDGVLTRFKGSTLGRLIAEIETRPEPATIDLGFTLLAMSESATRQLNEIVDRIAARTRADGLVHDASFAFKEGKGLTIHCTDEDAKVAMARLRSYCERRKYKEKANEWFGLCMASVGPDVRFGISLTSPWVEDAELEEASRSLRDAIPIDRVLAEVTGEPRRKHKIGRNALCNCGSGLKFKKCCLA